MKILAVVFVTSLAFFAAGTAAIWKAVSWKYH